MKQSLKIQFTTTETNQVVVSVMRDNVLLKVQVLNIQGDHDLSEYDMNVDDMAEHLMDFDYRKAFDLVPNDRYDWSLD